MTKNQHLPLICAFAGAIAFNLIGYAIENHALTGSSFAFKGIAGLIVGYVVGVLISKRRKAA